MHLLTRVPVNHGKWILRYLFQNLIDEEIKRDEAHRQKLNEVVTKRIAAAKSKPSPTLQIPTTSGAEEAIESPSTPRPAGSQLVPATPGGMGIGLATPIYPGAREDLGSPVDRKLPQAGRASQERVDYFSSAIESAGATSHAAKSATTPAVPEPAEDKAKSEDGKDKEKDKDGKNTPFGKKFRMSFSTKKLRSGSATVADKPAVVDEKAVESEASSNHGPEKEYDDNFLGVLERIRDEYEKQLSEEPDKLIETKIEPSLPNETPVLQIPPGTQIIIQEETDGGNAELYRGTVRSAGQEATKIEQCALQWLGEVLLRNTIPHKDPVKVSFVLHPAPNSGLPALVSSDGNNRLNANKMLRVKKILAYVAERIDPTPEADDAEQDAEQVTEALKPEEYLELYCNDQVSSLFHGCERIPKVDDLLILFQQLPINMTLATLRAYIWKNANDVVLHYKANGKKEILPRPAAEAAPKADEGEVAVTEELPPATS